MSDVKGEPITLRDGRLSVPDRPILPFIEGDGTGPDIWRASVRVFDAAVKKAYGGKRTIAWREVRTYFTSPLAYVVISVFLLLGGYIFWASLVRFSELCLRFESNPYFSSQLNVNDMVVRPLFGTMGIILLLMIPVITMRLLAEEHRTGTDELLFTCPVTSGQVVLGKFLGAAFLLVVMLSGTLAYPLLILGSGARPDMKPTLIGYLGVLLMGLAFLAIGLLISAMTENQVVAAVGSFGVLLLLWVMMAMLGPVYDSFTKLKF